jgi:hypothetical protein
VESPRAGANAAEAPGERHEGSPHAAANAEHERPEEDRPSTEEADDVGAASAEHSGAAGSTTDEPAGAEASGDADVPAAEDAIEAQGMHSQSLHEMQANDSMSVCCCRCEIRSTRHCTGSCGQSTRLQNAHQ